MTQNEQLDLALLRVKTGNACNEPEGFVRDMTMRKKEYWETLPYPKVLSHWTEDEFAEFLAKHRYPPNTLRDREVSRMLAIRSALVRGDFIPREVMADAVTVNAVADALMEISASFAWDARTQEQQLGILAFEKAIGYLRPAGEYHSRLDALLAQAANAAGRRATDSGCTLILSEVKEVGLDGLPYNLTVSMRTPDSYNRYSGQRLWLEVRDARYNDVSLYGDVHRIPYSQADSIFRRLVTEERVTLEQACTMMGSNWTPYVRVAVTSSLEAAAA
jgi:hypothetical protein